MSRKRELPVDRLSTSDERGRRLWLYPSDVRGRFRRSRTRVQVLLIAFFLVLPWLRIHGHPALLLDISHRRFSILGATFWDHDAPMLLLVLGGAVLSLALISSLFGRAWCGWACPQTVFIDGVFRRIERWMEGDSVERKRLDQGPWSTEKTIRKSVKWLLYLLVSLVLTHSFLAYFVGTDELLAMMHSSPFRNPEDFLVIAISTSLILFNFGWFREQFCTIACPYGRFQSVLMDRQSLLIAYDARRGEPRGPVGSGGGDCVNCYRCVQVCPTGIDIRRGQQLECIACTACIDACDDVMSRLKREAGLIRYSSERRIQDRSDSADSAWKTRFWLYGAILLVIVSGLTIALLSRKPLDVRILRLGGTPYEFIRAPKGAELVLNKFKMEITNQGFTDLSVSIESRDADRKIELIVPQNGSSVPAGKTRIAEVLIRFPREALTEGHRDLRMDVLAEAPGQNSKSMRTEEVRLVGPY